jgi:hypothetical protein
MFATKSAAHRWFITWEKNGFLQELLNAYQNITEMGPELKLPRRRHRLPSVKTLISPAIAS